MRTGHNAESGGGVLWDDYVLRVDGGRQDLHYFGQFHGLQVQRPHSQVPSENWRIINQVYSDIQTLYDQQITVRVSYLEIYNESLYDLLNPNETSNDQQNLAIQEDERGQIVVKGLI